MEKYKKNKFHSILLPEITSTGTTGKEWIQLLKEAGFTYDGAESTSNVDVSKEFFNDKKFRKTITKGVVYRPLVVTSRDSNVARVKKNYLERGYRLAPMEVFPLLLTASWFEDFLRDMYKAKPYYELVCMHEGIQLNGPNLYTSDNYLLSLIGLKKIRGESDGKLINSNYLYIFIK